MLGPGSVRWLAEVEVSAAGAHSRRRSADQEVMANAWREKAFLSYYLDCPEARDDSCVPVQHRRGARATKAGAVPHSRSPKPDEIGKICKCELSAHRSWRLYTFRTQTLAPNIAINCKWRAGPQDGGRWQDLQLTANCRSSGTCPETHPGTGSSARVPP